ncbi:DUF6105 family protein [Aureimonas glaciei]|uniref:Uncharacterized protein n=1 Tax=Aureimonas glaciei TaxID=1776957 RepID=A0A916Y0B7_9HYPH|nr:DUF6105 family protein [Aureimonas glaciei]GGD25616.1 hypothetical protein GCM10011335_30680 [Aureimonas glaciei]
MKLVFLWLGATAAFWLWFVVSLHDASLGLFVLSRDFHDAIMAVYGWTLGVEPTRVPRLFAEAFALDGLLVLGILAFRRRRRLLVWCADARTRGLSWLRRTEWKRAGRAHPAE